MFDTSVGEINLHSFGSVYYDKTILFVQCHTSLVAVWNFLPYSIFRKYILLFDSEASLGYVRFSKLFEQEAAFCNIQVLKPNFVESLGNIQEHGLTQFLFQ